MVDEEALITTVLRDLSVEASVEMRQFGAGAPVDEMYQVYARMMCYIFMVLIILCVSNIMSAFRRPDLRMRNLCTQMKPRSMSFQQILCGVLVSMVAWLLLTVIGFAMYGSNLSGTDGRIVGLILLNTFVVTLVALAIASLTSPFIKSPNSQNAVANFVSLGLSFLGGVFVPLDMLGEGLLAAARFTPPYWYVTALNRICALTTFDGDAMTPIWQAISRSSPSPRLSSVWRLSSASTSTSRSDRLAALERSWTGRWTHSHSSRRPHALKTKWVFGEKSRDFQI